MTADASAGGDARRRFTGAALVLNKFTGFALSMLLLAVASLVVIPAMVYASGAEAWGVIAAGQSIGAVAAVLVAFGWGMSGPARVARADEIGRLNEYSDALVAKLIIFLPVGAAAFTVAWLIGGDFPAYAALGALSAASIGLTANWYFVGMAQPYTMLLVETVPRVAGTVVGIGLMLTGSSALVGLFCQLAGMVAAFIACSLLILRPWDRRRLRRVQRRPLLAVLAEQRHGLSSSVVSASYAAAPIVIVGLVAPAVLPVYAIVDKVQRQINAALAPYVTVLQGWVPRGKADAVLDRARRALAVSAVGGAVLAVVLLIVAPALLDWLGRGEIQPPYAALILMSVIVAVNMLESVASKACLSALGRLDVAARATLIATAVGLVLIVFGVFFWGVLGALSGILAGLLLRILLELLGMRRRPSPPNTPGLPSRRKSENNT